MPIYLCVFRHSFLELIKMLRESIMLVLFLAFAKISQAQEIVVQKLFKKIDVDAGFLFYPTKEADFITGWDIYADISQKWAIGLNGFVPIKFVHPIQTNSQVYLITGIFARYKTKPNSFFYNDMGLGYGNLCYCDLQPNYRGFHRFNNYTYYLQAGLGTRYLELNAYIRFRPSVKAFYLFKSAPNKQFIFRPYLAVAIPIVKRNPSQIMNPRF